MAHSDTAHILGLVRIALDEFDSIPLSATARRTARIASLLGESELAVWIHLELTSSNGKPATNADEIRRMLDDPDSWDDPDGPANRAMHCYLENRTIRGGDSDGLILSHSLDGIEMWLLEGDANESPTWIRNKVQMHSAQDGIRGQCFTALCKWERQLSYTNINEQIFNRFKSTVDERLAAGAPQVLEQFTAVYRRLHEAARRGDDVSEELAQAVSSCRRILKAIVDHLLPGEHGATTEEGNKLDDGAYKNRVFEIVKMSTSGESTAAVLKAQVGGLIERFNATDSLASKGVHAAIGTQEAEICAISTYVVAGELLSLTPS